MSAWNGVCVDIYIYIYIACHCQRTKHIKYYILYYTILRSNTPHTRQIGWKKLRGFVQVHLQLKETNLVLEVTDNWFLVILVVLNGSYAIFANRLH